MDDSPDVFPGGAFSLNFQFVHTRHFAAKAAPNLRVWTKWGCFSEWLRFGVDVYREFLRYLIHAHEIRLMAVGSVGRALKLRM